MSQELLAGLLKNVEKAEDKELFLEALTTISDPISKRIIDKAASPHSPVTIDEFPDLSESTMARYLYLLQTIGVLKPMWENDQRKFAITQLGKEIDTIIKNGISQT